MAKTVQKRRLGRGIAALIGDDLSEDQVLDKGRSLRHVAPQDLSPNPHNPRKNFSEKDLGDLVSSISANGLLQPLVVRPVKDGGGRFQIVAGERRWRAAAQAGLHEVPVIVRDFSDAETLEIALVENVQRTDLNALEEAEGYQQLLDRFGYSHKQLSKTIGKSRSHVANTLRLRNLPGPVQDLVRGGRLSAGHARALLSSADAERLARRIIAEGLSVRETEDIVRRETAESTPGAGRSPGSARAKKDADTRALERDLSEMLGLRVEIVHRGRGGGKVSISYTTLEQLDEICRRLSQARGK